MESGTDPLARPAKRAELYGKRSAAATRRPTAPSATAEEKTGIRKSEEQTALAKLLVAVTDSPYLSPRTSAMS